MRDVLGKPRKELGGLSICPWIKRYWKQIHIVETDDIVDSVERNAQMMVPLGVEAIVFVGWDMDYDEIYELNEDWNEKLKIHDVVCLLMHPDTQDPPLPLEYNFKQPLLIMQKRSTLARAKQITKKNTDYYTYFDR